MSERIEKAIRESDADVRRVADACGVTAQAVYAWMRGDVKNLKNENLFALADETGFEARLLATGKLPERTVEGDQRMERLKAAYQQADERGKDAILRVAQAESSYGVKEEHPKERAA